MIAAALSMYALEQHERYDDEYCPLVDRIEQPVQVRAHPVVGRHVRHLRAVASKALEQVHVGRKFKIGHDDPAARSIVAMA